MTNFEKIVRPSVAVSPLPEPKDRKPPELRLPEAHIRWGKPSDFDIKNVRDRLNSFRTAEPELPPLFGEWREEGRTWTDFKMVDPENPDENWVMVRATDAIAFAPHYNSIVEPRHEIEQLIFTASNGYTPSSDGIPAYLKNEKGEEFEPIVLDPWTQVIEVGWPRNDFVLISLLFKPRTHVTTGVRLDSPMDKAVGAPEDEDVNPYGTDWGEPPVQPEKVFMDEWQKGNVIDADEDNPGIDIPMKPRGVEEFEDGSFDWPNATKFFGNNDGGPSGTSPKFKSDHLAAFKWPALFDLYIQRLSSEPGFGGCTGPFDGAWIPQSEMTDPSGCYFPWTTSKFVGYAGVIVPGMSNLHINNIGADGELIEIPGEDFTDVRQWKVDTQVVHRPGNFSNSIANGDTIQGTSRNSNFLGGEYNFYTVYRLWEGKNDVKYDDDPFVFALYLVDVWWLRKYFGEDIFPPLQNPKPVEISIWAGDADDADAAQGAAGANMAPKSAKIRLVWMKGNSFEFAEKLKSMDLSVAPGSEPQVSEFGEQVSSDADPPTEEQVWAALLNGEGYLSASDTEEINEGIRWVSEEVFPGGSAIEGEFRKQLVYTVNYGEKKLEIKT